MEKKILWIDDDYFHIQPLFYQVEQQGFKIDYALTAAEGYEKAKNWKNYRLIVVDIILQLQNPNQKTPEIVKSWASEAYPGIGVVKWLLRDHQVKCPVIILSVIDDLLDRYELQDIGVAKVISKTSLGPTLLFQELSEYLKS